MILLKIKHIDAGGRLDKYLLKFLKDAPTSFIYKMLRKKNIVLNGKKAAGNEFLKENDEVKLFLADETIVKFGGKVTLSQTADREYVATAEDSIEGSSDDSLYNFLKSLKWEFDEPKVIYEDRDIIILNKPVNVLSQIAKRGDISMNEWLISYLINSKSLTAEDMLTVKPAVVNRLDRNTSGIILAGKTLTGLRFLSDIIKARTLKKYYLTIVKGEVLKNFTAEAYLLKNDNHNTVKIYQDKVEGADYIKTAYEVLEVKGGHSLLKVELITGKSHQIRAHLSFLGYPVIGDGKYGLKSENTDYRRMGLSSQFLHSYEIQFPKFEGEFAYLSGKKFNAKLPERLEKVSNKLGFNI
ncbi:MAG: RluA family pseudouridine synthase [Catonella sp.]|uniref:RluA family pseudouridine synthase n=1 Tax=Catonella sp. TaxID=2382125 RepID=UPI003FA111E8